MWISQKRNIPFKRSLHVPCPGSINEKKRTRAAKMRSPVEIKGFGNTQYHTAVNSITNHITIMPRANVFKTIPHYWFNSPVSVTRDADGLYYRLKAAALSTGDFYLAIFLNRQQTLRTFV